MIAIFLVVFVMVTAIVDLYVPAVPPLGYDWRHCFSIGAPAFYPPWASYITGLLTWPLLCGITLGAVSCAILKHRGHLVSSAAALLSLPVWWTLFNGQLDGIVLLGLLALPYAMPLATLKPQIAIFALLTQRKHVIALAVVLVISLLIWGPWPLDMNGRNIQEHTGYGLHPRVASLGLLGIPIGLVLLWLSRGDPEMMMLAGSFVTPYWTFLSLLPATPAIARLSPKRAVVALILSWLPFSANWLGPAGWWFIWVFVSWLWLCLYLQRKQTSLEESENFKVSFTLK